MGWFKKKRQEGTMDEEPFQKSIISRKQENTSFNQHSQDNLNKDPCHSINNITPKLPELSSMHNEIDSIKSTIENRPNQPPQNSNNTLHPINNRIIPPESLTLPILNSIHKNVPDIPKNITMQTEPVFVKIDKFREVTENFEKIKSKVSDIEKMFNEIKQIKEKENRELQEWENEIHSIKTRVSLINDSLFKK